MSTSPSFEEYCKRLNASDRSAFGDLFRLLREELIRYVHRIVKDEALAHDLIQDVFISLWGLRTSLDPSRSLKAYIYQMAKNRAIRHLRDERIHDEKHKIIKQQSSGKIPKREQPDAMVDVSTLSTRLKVWIEELPDRQREAILLSRFQGLSHREIADIMAISPRTVNNHIMRALTHLQHRIEAFEPSLLEL